MNYTQNRYVCSNTVSIKAQCTNEVCDRAVRADERLQCVATCEPGWGTISAWQQQVGGLLTASNYADNLAAAELSTSKIGSSPCRHPTQLLSRCSGSALLHYRRCTCTYTFSCLQHFWSKQCWHFLLN